MGEIVKKTARTLPTKRGMRTEESVFLMGHIWAALARRACPGLNGKSFRMTRSQMCVRYKTVEPLS